MRYARQQPMADLFRVERLIPRAREYRNRQLLAVRTAMPAPSIHLGRHLVEELRELDTSASALACRFHVSMGCITAILNGRPTITYDAALRLAPFFCTSTEFWINLQDLYELRMAENKNRSTFTALPRLEQQRAQV